MADDGEIARRLLAAGLLHRPDLAPEGPTRIGPFEVLRVLSRGPRAEVLLAVAPPEGPVAVKVPAGARRDGEDAYWKREAAVLARCAGPGVVHLVSSGTCDGRPYLATAFVGARNLAAGGLGLVDLVTAVEGAARACDRLHAGGLVHRALSPEHVLLGDAAPLTAWVTGLGLSAAIGERARPDEAGGLKVVRLASTAPELLAGEPCDPRADVYALGALLHRGLTGELPTAGARGVPDPAPFVARRDGQPPPAPLLAAARRALARRPDERFDTAAAFAEALRAGLAQVPPGTASTHGAWRALRARLGGP